MVHKSKKPFSRKRVNRIYRSIVKDQGLLEDRREFDIEDFTTSYDISKREARLLFMRVQKRAKRPIKK